MRGEKTEKAVLATFLSVFQIIPAASFVKITKSPETIVVSGLLTMVRVVIQHFSKNTVISMVLGHPNSEITCIPPS